MNITEIVIGDTLDFETSVPDYPNTDDWTLNYRLLLLESAGTAISFTAGGTPVDDPLGYRVQLAPATTAAWTAGTYAWNSYLTKTGARYTVESGQVVLLPDPAVTTAPRDNRSMAAQTLAAIETVLLRRAGKDASEYTVKDRQWKYTPIPDLIKLRDYYAGLVRAEQNALLIANGQAPKSKVVVRL